MVRNKIVVNNKLFFVFFGMVQGVNEIFTKESTLRQEMVKTRLAVLYVYIFGSKSQFNKWLCALGLDKNNFVKIVCRVCLLCSKHKKNRVKFLSRGASKLNL